MGVPLQSPSPQSNHGKMSHKPKPGTSHERPAQNSLENSQGLEKQEKAKKPLDQRTLGSHDTGAGTEKGQEESGQSRGSLGFNSNAPSQLLSGTCEL